MKMNKYINIMLFALLALSACTDDSIFQVPTGDAIITEFDGELTFPTDTIRLYGKFIPLASPRNFLVFNDSILIPSSDCLKWTATTIEFIIPDSLLSGKVYCIFDKDSSQKFDITILKYMPFKTVTVAGGKFLMGSDLGLFDESPVREVTISKPLIVAETELSQRLFEYIMKYNPSDHKDNSLPIYNVEWIDAIRFCNLLSEKDNLEPAYTIIGAEVTWDSSANGWRLPTEAEWEYAARGTSTGDYVGSVLGNYAWYLENSGSNPHNIGTLQANSNGLFDVLGNVREWCWDYYSAYYYSSGENVNPAGPASGERRISRGGSITEGKSYLRLSARKLQSENTPTGMRLVRN